MCFVYKKKYYMNYTMRKKYLTGIHNVTHVQEAYYRKDLSFPVLNYAASLMVKVRHKSSRMRKALPIAPRRQC